MKGKHAARAASRREQAARLQSERQRTAQEQLQAEYAELLQVQQRKAVLLEEASALWKALDTATSDLVVVENLAAEQARQDAVVAQEAVDELKEAIRRALFSTILIRDKTTGEISLDDTRFGYAGTQDFVEAVGEYIRDKKRPPHRHELKRREMYRRRWEGKVSRWESAQKKDDE